MGNYILTSDQGTTSSRAILFDFKRNILEKPVRCPVIWETTALGVAYLAEFVAVERGLKWVDHHA